MARESQAQAFARLPKLEREKRLAALSPAEAAALAYDWRFWARPDQIEPPGAWRVWLALAGRGWGKTRTGGEWVREQSKVRDRGILAAPTAADARDVMIEGESGILAISPPWDRPVYEPSKRRLTFPNGSRCTILSADEPERFRGQQCEYFWADELAAWRYPEAWDQLMFGLRLGSDPRGIVTTTPRPTKLVRDLVASETTHITKGSTHDNAANLAPAFIEAILAKYEGTTLGQQEIYAEMLSETEGALWTRGLIEDHRVGEAPILSRVVVGVDPAVTSKKASDLTGIGIGGIAENGHGYFLEDASARLTPEGWGQRVISRYHSHHADRVIGEVNNGGDLVETILRQIDRQVSYRAVHASKGKYARAEPIAALYEQGKIHHVGLHADLEDQMCTWTPDSADSPDRMDALVWTFTELMMGSARPRLRSLA